MPRENYYGKWFFMDPPKHPKEYPWVYIADSPGYYKKHLILKPEDYEPLANYIHQKFKDKQIVYIQFWNNKKDIRTVPKND